LKTCRCRAVVFEKRSYGAAAAMVFKKVFRISLL
jgi:hypothetical protein